MICVLSTDTGTTEIFQTVLVFTRCEEDWEIEKDLNIINLQNNLSKK